MQKMTLLLETFKQSYLFQTGCAQTGTSGFSKNKNGLTYRIFAFLDAQKDLLLELGLIAIFPVIRSDAPAGL